MVRQGLRGESSRRHPLLAAALAVFIGLPWLLTQSVPHVAAATTTTDLMLDVISARDSTLRPPRGDDDCAPWLGMHLSDPNANRPAGCADADLSDEFEYKWIINDDNTGDPHQATPSYGIDPSDTTIDGSDVCHPLTATNPDGDPDFPANCNWPSVHPVNSSAVITQGDSSEWNLTDAITTLPDGNYLVSVSADGFEIGGAHFTVPVPVAAAGPATIKVGLNPYPIPLGTIQVKVFEDSAPADGTFDATTEHGLEGWNATVADILGAMSTDWYVNPICTEYERIVPTGLDASPPGDGTMTPTEAFAYYGDGGPGETDATNYYGGGNPDHIFSYADYVTWGVSMVDGSPVRVPGTGGKCLSDANGIIRIPNLGSNRYSITVTPPGDLDNQDRWSQTTTLEGGHDWDFWMMANDSGVDSEMVQAGEPVPWAMFGFVDVTAPNTITADTANTGEIKGTVLAAEPYVPGQGGFPGQGGAGGQSGLRYARPLGRVRIALNDFDNGDQVGYTTLNNPDGTFDIQNVKDGTYLMSVWDLDQDYAIDFFNVTVVGGQTVDLGNVPLLGWFTRITGHVFVDSNANGKRDPGEAGVPNFDVVLKNRTNDSYVSGQNVSVTDSKGYYALQMAYPVGAFIIEEFFNTRYKTTGVTWQADNDPQEHTVLTAAVDISTLNIIGQDGRIDVGVLPYDAQNGENGGIVASVAYDATRNELQGRKAATEPYEPGIPGIDLNIFAPVPCASVCDPTGTYELDGDGSYATAPLVVGDDPNTADVAPGNVDATATYRSETWRRPASCIPRDSNGNPVVQDAIKFGTTGRSDQDCVEAVMLGTTFGFSDGDVGAADGQSVDGNYGFVTYRPGDYLVSVTIPTDPIFNRPLYKVRAEDAIDVFSGDVYVPQGADVTGMVFADFLKANRYDPTVPQLPSVGVREPTSTTGPYPDAACVGPLVTIDADPSNVDLHNVGGSPYEDQQVHSCSMKLIHVEGGQSVAPNFLLYTDVPIPAKFYGYVTDDVSVSTDRRSLALGEVQGIGDVPVGLYDWTNRLLTTVDTDSSGLFEVLMPSTNSYNCPLPAGPCAGMYRFVGNDPGQPQRPNLNYNDQYRTIAANFQAWPGVFTLADTAPTRAVIQIEGPGTQFRAAVICKADATEPQLFRVDWPYVPNSNTYVVNNSQATGTIEIYGQGFGATRGSISLTNDAGTVTTYNDATRLPLWSADGTHVTLSIPLTGTGNLPGGAYQMNITQAAAAGGLTTVNGLTIHVLKSTYTTVASGNSLNLRQRFPDVAHVGPLSTLRRIDAGVNDLAPNAPYTNWGETNRNNMFTPIDASQFYFPGPIQKAINYGWDRWLNVPALLQAIINAVFGPNDPARSAALQAVGAKNRHPLIITYPRFDNNPVTGAPATDPVTGQPSFDPDDPALAFNHNGAYYESPVMYYPAKIQGAGPGGIYPDTSGGVTGPISVYGSVVDGRYFNAATNKPAGNTSDLVDAPTDVFLFDPSLFAEPYASLWETFVVFRLGGGAAINEPVIPPPASPLPSWFAYGWDGQQAPTEGEVFYVLAHNGDYTSGYRAAIDGLTISGGDQKGFPGNRNEQGGGRTANAPDENFVLDIQGGAIMVNAYARFLRITNNSVIANSGASGAIRIGSPQLGTDTEDGNTEGDPATGETFPTYDQQNTDVRVAHNRITANGGTSLGGALSLFNGSERYRVDHNEFCGNFSAEYGGAISHFGLSKNGEIDHNKIYLNESVDEGGGIMIAGEPHLDPATSIPLPGTLSNGSGRVKVHDNYITANLAGDDGAGIRFLQAGNWQADVYNNMITNNVSTHEGGGIALNDSTNVRIFNNTIAKNLTTATAVTSNGAPAPAGLSTGDNSSQLQACNATPTYTRTRGRTTNGSAIYQLQAGAPNPASNFVPADVGATLVSPNIPAGAQIVSVAGNGRSVVLSEAATATSPASASPGLTFSVFRACSGMPPQSASPSPFSNPLLFNNVFDDNRAGNWQSTGTNPGVHGLGFPGDPIINRWDMGTADGSGLLNPSSSIIDDDAGHGFTDDGTNNCLSGCGTTHASTPNSNYPQFVGPFNLIVSISPWRVNPRFRPAAIVGVSLPANAIGDYHIVGLTSPAFNTATASKTAAPFGTVSAPTNDIDGDGRPALGGFDRGADEFGGLKSDLSITKTDGVATVGIGGSLTYTVVVTNNGPAGITSAPVTDTFPTALTVASWTCTATVGSSCTATGSGNSRAGTVTLLNGGSATFIGTATVASPVLPASIPLPVFTGVTQPLDNFNRGDANNLNTAAPAGVSWNEPAILGVAATRVNTSQASDVTVAGQAIWNGTRNGGPTLTAKQGAAFTFVQSAGLPASPLTGTSLILKATGGSASLACTPLLSVCLPTNFIRVRYTPITRTLANTATVAMPFGWSDPNTVNNTATDTDTVPTGQVEVATTTNGAATTPTYTLRGSFVANFTTNDRLTAQVSVLASPANTVAVDVWKTTGVTSTYLGRVTFVQGTTFTGTGRIGIQLPVGARVDDFNGGTVP